MRQRGASTWLRKWLQFVFLKFIPPLHDVNMLSGQAARNWVWSWRVPDLRHAITTSRCAAVFKCKFNIKIINFVWLSFRSKINLVANEMMLLSPSVSYYSCLQEAWHCGAWRSTYMLASCLLSRGAYAACLFGHSLSNRRSKVQFYRPFCVRRPSWRFCHGWNLTLSSSNYNNLWAILFNIAN